MLLCLDVGNTQIFGGIFEKNKILLTFRNATNSRATSDQLGVFLKSVIKENNFDPKKIKAVAISSVVPSIDYSLRSACLKYFSLDPFFLSPIGTNGIIIKFKEPNTVGSDIIAGCIAAGKKFPKKDLIIVDLGTATTIVALTKNQEFLGGTILAGIRITMDALKNNAAKLFPVEIIKPEEKIGTSTASAIQLGIYYGHLGAMQKIIALAQSNFSLPQKALVIATGGFVHLFEKEKIFDHIIPDLVLEGIKIAWEINKK
jgi:type III pantothenate kinase